MKLASQMPSSTSLMPSFWPVSTVCGRRGVALTFQRQLVKWMIEPFHIVVVSS
jgi:hypothetical protein